MGVTVEFDLARLEAFQLSIFNATNTGLLSAGKMVEQLASELAPKDTWELSKSGKVELQAGNVVEVSFGNSNGIPDNDPADGRAVFQEFGTSTITAQPYLLPAAASISIAEEVAKAIKAVI
jgi:hypothetical protein